MRDHRFTLAPGEEVQVEARFRFLRIVESGRQIQLGFPTGRLDVSDFERGDILRFEDDQKELIVRNPLDVAQTVWLKSAGGVVVESALLVGDVTITGVEQGAEDSPLVVREGRGVDFSAAEAVQYQASGTQPPGLNYWFEPLYLYHFTARTFAGNVAFLHITNNNAIPLAGSLSNIVDTRVAVAVNTGSGYVVVRWIAASETVRLPVTGQSLAFGQIINAGDVQQGNVGRVTVVPEYE